MKVDWSFLELTRRRVGELERKQDRGPLDADDQAWLDALRCQLAKIESMVDALPKAQL